MSIFRRPAEKTANSEVDPTFLEDLELVSWRRFRTVYGNSGRLVQSLLRELFLGRNLDKNASKLMDELIHQGWHESASVPAVPFVARLLKVMPERLLPALIDLLLTIAIGFETSCLGHKGLSGSNYSDQQAYDVVAASAHLLLPFLAHPAEAVQQEAIRFCGWMPNVKELSLPILRETSLKHSEDCRVTAYVALALLRDTQTKVAQGSARVRYASTLVYLETHRLGDDELRTLLEMSRWRYEPERYAKTKSIGDIDAGPYGFSLMEYAVELLHRLGPETVAKFRQQAVPGAMLTQVKTRQPWRSGSRG